MATDIRSPFGIALREERKKRNLSQVDLANLIAERFASDDQFASLGMISDRAIANIEASRKSPADFTRPRPETVTLLLAALDIDPASTAGMALLEAAEATRRRETGLHGAGITPERLPFIRDGREAFLQTLQSRWQRALTGQPSIAILSGNAGAGKTRLIQEFYREVARENPQVVVAIGECSAGMGSVDPYLPFRQALNVALGYSILTGLATPRASTWSEDALRRLAPTVSGLAGAIIDPAAYRSVFTEAPAAMRDDVETHLAVQSPTDAQARFGEVMRLIAAVTVDHPLILVLEDVHWASEVTCSLLQFMHRQARQAEDLRLMVIASYRLSDLADTEERHPLASAINEITRQDGSAILTLEDAWKEQGGKAFVQGLARSLPVVPEQRQDLSDFLFDRAHGHPLFTTELVWNLLETAALKRDGGATWRWTRPDSDVPLSGKVRSIIAERVERLPDDQRRVLEVAAIQAPEINDAILAKVADVAPDTLDRLLDAELVERHHLLQYDAARVIGGRRTHVYRFDHSLFAEYLDETMSPRRREHLHHATAEALLSEFASAELMTAPAVAWHYAMAEEWSLAARYANLASSSALLQMDHDLAEIRIKAAEEYAQLGDDPGQLMLARSRRAQLYRDLGQLEESLDYATEIFEKATAGGHLQTASEAEDIIAFCLYDLGHTDQAIRHLEHSVTLHHQFGNAWRESGNYSMLSHAHLRIGEFEKARGYATRALETAPEPGRDGLSAEAMLALGNCNFELARYEDALTSYRRGLERFLETGEKRGEMLCRCNIGLCLSRLHRHDDAIPWLDQTQTIANRLPSRRMRAWLEMYRGLALEAVEDYPAALTAYRSSLRIRREMASDNLIGDNLAGLLRIALATEESIPARLSAMQAWMTSHDIESLEDPLLVFLTLAQGCAATGDQRGADEAAAEGKRILCARAKGLSDPDLRAGYLAHQPSGRALQELTGPTCERSRTVKVASRSSRD